MTKAQIRVLKQADIRWIAGHGLAAGIFGSLVKVFDKKGLLAFEYPEA